MSKLARSINAEVFNGLSEMAYLKSSKASLTILSFIHALPRLIKAMEEDSLHFSRLVVVIKSTLVIMSLVVNVAQ